MKNFKNLTRGEKAYRLNEAVEGLNAETAYYGSSWLEIWPDGAGLKEAKEAFDDETEDYEELERKFKFLVEKYGCEDGRSIQRLDVEGLWIKKIDDPIFEEEERGGGFFLVLDGADGLNKVERVRSTLEAFGYPLTDIQTISRGRAATFSIDWKAWRAAQAAKFIDESISWLVENDRGCCTLRLTKSSQLAVGWTNGYDPDDRSLIHSKTQPSWVVAVAIKSWEGDDLKTDLDFLTTPYVVGGDDDGMVFDLETPVSPNEDMGKVFSYLFKEYQEVVKEYKVYPDGRCVKR